MKRLIALSLLLLHTGIGLAETAPSQEDAITIGKLRFGISNQELLLQQSTQEEQTLLEKLRLINEDLAAHQRKIDELKAKIDERLLSAYGRIRSNVRNGLAVVTVKRDACGGCFNRIPPQRQVEIRQGKKLIVCEYCGRILVADPEEGME